MNIARTILDIDESLDPEIQLHLQNYWAFKEGGFTNAPLAYCKKNNLNIYSFRKIIKESSSFLIEYSCEECNEGKYIYGCTQHDFKIILDYCRKYNSCPCRRERIMRDSILQGYHSEVNFNKHYINAIKNKVWRNLPADELKIFSAFFDYEDDMDSLEAQDKIVPYEKMENLIKKLNEMYLFYSVCDDELMECHLMVNHKLKKAVLKDLNLLLINQK